MAGTEAPVRPDRSPLPVVLTRPAVAAVETVPRSDDGWHLDLELTDEQADGHGCIRCGERGGPMVPVGWVRRPEAVLRRLGVFRVAEDSCQIFAHEECREVEP
jgi:hypothetical protein